MSLLRVEGLAKKYRSRQVVKDLSLEVARGEVVGLLGPNGAGKTTAFYMIVGLVPTDAGRIIIDDQDVSRLPVHRRARLGLGYLPQEPSVFRKLSVRDNIYAILETRPELDAQRREIGDPRPDVVVHSKSPARRVVNRKAWAMPAKISFTLFRPADPPHRWPFLPLRQPG